MTERFELAGKRVWVSGHRGLAGSAIMRRLASERCEILTSTRRELDLLRQADVESWIAENKPEVIFLAAGTVGGIYENSARPAEFIHDNMMIANNIIHSAYTIGVEKLMYLGSACIYPRDAAQPMAEDVLLSGPLEPTNEWYAIAKIAGIKLCQAYRRQYGCDFISAQPNNLYGPGDNFDLMSSHVIPALMVKAHNAKAGGAMEVWGSGKPLREFLFIDDLADALVFLMKHYSGPAQVNIGTGDEISIRDLATTIAKVVGFDGDFVFDSDKPDGAPRKLLDVSLMESLGWSATTPLEAGLQRTYDWFLKTLAEE